MIRFRVRLDTMQDVNEFVNVSTSISSRVTLSDNDCHSVNGKSLLGCLYSMEFDKLYVTCDAEESSKFDKFKIQ